MCGERTAGCINLCEKCYGEDKEYPQHQCSVCHITFGDTRKAAPLPTKLRAAYLRHLQGTSEHAVQFRASVAGRRDLIKCPLRVLGPKDPLCNSGCIFQHRREAESRRFLGRHPGYGGSSAPSEAPRGRKPSGLTGPCRIPNCANKIEDVRARQAGAHFDSWDVFFSQARNLPIYKGPKFTPETAVCNKCYMEWYNHRGTFWQPRARENYQGVESYKDAIVHEEKRLLDLDWAIQRATDQGTGREGFFSIQKVKLRFRVLVLSNFLAANKTVTLDELREILKGMIEEADAVGKELGHLDMSEQTRKLRRWVEKELELIADLVPIGISSADVAIHGRKTMPFLYPWASTKTQVESVIANLYQRFEAEKAEARRLKDENDLLRQSTKSKKPADDPASVRTDGKPRAVDICRSTHRVGRKRAFSTGRIPGRARLPGGG